MNIEFKIKRIVNIEFKPISINYFILFKKKHVFISTSWIKYCCYIDIIWNGKK